MASGCNPCGLVPVPEGPVCRIAGAGRGFPSFAPLARTGRGELLIAADGGCLAFSEAGIEPDVILGDFDSLGSVPEGPNVLRWPEHKDDTDMMLAVRLGLERGFRRFYLYGGTGGRLDHTLANLQTLAFLAEHGAAGFLFGENETLTVTSGGADFPPLAEGLLSVFAAGGEARCVTLHGLEYGLENAALSPAFPLGVSNHFNGGAAEIRLAAGRLLLSWSPPVLPRLYFHAGDAPC